MASLRSVPRRAARGWWWPIVAICAFLVVGGAPITLQSAWQRFCGAADEARTRFATAVADVGRSPIGAPTSGDASLFHDLAFEVWAASPSELDPALAWLARAVCDGPDASVTTTTVPTRMLALDRIDFVDAIVAELWRRQPAERVTRASHIADYGIGLLRRANTLVDQFAAVLCVERALDLIDTTAAADAFCDAPDWAACERSLAALEAAVPGIEALATGWEVGVRAEAVELGSVRGKSFAESLGAALQRPVLVARAGEIARAREVIASTAGLPWSEVSSRLAALDGGVAGAGGSAPFAAGLQWFDPYLGGVDCVELPRTQRRLLARLRLSRLRAHWFATGETLQLDDPFGSVLQIDHERTCAHSAEPGLRVAL